MEDEMEEEEEEVEEEEVVDAESFPRVSEVFHPTRVRANTLHPHHDCIIPEVPPYLPNFPCCDACARCLTASISGITWGSTSTCRPWCAGCRGAPSYMARSLPVSIILTVLAVLVVLMLPHRCERRR